MKNQRTQVQVKAATVESENSLLTRVGAVPAAIAFTLLALLLPACDTPTEETTEEGVTIEELEEEPSEYVGQTVVVGGEVENIVSPDAFILQDEELFGDNDVLVVGAEGALLEEGAFARVQGVAQQYTVTEVEDQYAVDIGTEYEIVVQERPVIEATEVAVYDTEDEYLADEGVFETDGAFEDEDDAFEGEDGTFEEEPPIEGEGTFEEETPADEGTF